MEKLLKDEVNDIFYQYRTRQTISIRGKHKKALDKYQEL